MNKELEEAKVLLSNLKNTTNTQEYVNHFNIYDKAIETVLQALENSISKEVIKEKKQELEKEYKECLEENSTKAFILKCQIEGFKEFEKEVESKI